MSSVPDRDWGWFARTPTAKPPTLARAVTSWGAHAGGSSSAWEGRYDKNAAATSRASSASPAAKVAVPDRARWTYCPPSSSGWTVTPVIWATAAGPDTYTSERVVMTTASAMPSRRAGPDRRGPSTTHTTGTTPEQRANALATLPHPSKAPTSSSGEGPAEESQTTRGSLWERAEPAAAATLAAATAPSVCPEPWTTALTTERSPGRKGPTLTETASSFLARSAAPNGGSSAAGRLLTAQSPVRPNRGRSGTPSPARLAGTGPPVAKRPSRARRRAGGRARALSHSRAPNWARRQASRRYGSSLGPGCSCPNGTVGCPPSGSLPGAPSPACLRAVAPAPRGLCSGDVGASLCALAFR